MTASTPGTQLSLDLAREPSHRRRDFVNSPGNSEAIATVDAWPAWPGGKLALVGPSGSGKTHLARAWAERSGATIVTPNQPDMSQLADVPILFEDADRFHADEFLFHVMNLADAGRGLLVTGRSPPIAWRITLPDLRSRLNALMVVALSPPDDATLEGVLLKLFTERNIKPPSDVISYLLHRIERSIPTARDVVARIDEKASIEGREITRPLVREVIDETPPPFDPVD